MVTIQARRALLLTRRWDATASISRIVLLAPSSSTHSINLNQRMVRLSFTANNTTREATFRIPTSRNVLPPQVYFLFVLNGKTHSRPARWLHVMP
jgi:hypothetical protein